MNNIFHLLSPENCLPYLFDTILRDVVVFLGSYITTYGACNGFFRNNANKIDRLDVK